jgi:hypothetical protein
MVKNIDFPNDGCFFQISFISIYAWDDYPQRLNLQAAKISKSTMKTLGSQNLGTPIHDTWMCILGVSEQ